MPRRYHQPDASGKPATLICLDCARARRLAAAEGWPVVATDGDRDGVTRALLTWALRVLA